MEELHIAPIIQKTPNLNERSFGDYDGKPFDLMMQAFDTQGPNPKSVEHTTDFISRVLQGLEDTMRHTTAAGLVVTHVNVLAVIYCALFDTKRLPEYWEAYSADYCEGFVHDY